jgi:signal peptidase I
MIRLGLGISFLRTLPLAHNGSRKILNQLSNAPIRKQLYASVRRRLYHYHEGRKEVKWWTTMGIVSARILSVLSMISLVSEYSLEWTLCEGPSMKPTIAPKGDIILIERWSHRWYGLNGGDVGEVRSQVHQAKQNKEGSKDVSVWRGSSMLKVRNLWTQFFTSGINVGDVIVLHHPLKETTICKRVLGLPGDTVILASSSTRTDVNHTQKLKDIFLPGSHHLNSPSLNNSNLITVPDGHVWIEGDNSANSSDSRHYGTVPANLIIGKVICRIWPIFPISPTIQNKFRMIRMWKPSQSSKSDDQNINDIGSIVLPAGYAGEELPFDYYCCD